MNYIEIPKIESKVNTRAKRLHKQSKFIEHGKVDLIHPDYPFSNVGLMLLVARWDQER